MAVSTIATSILLGVLALAFAFEEDHWDKGNTKSYAERAPIEIGGDGNFTAENGVVSGSGTASDPFVIGGWEINASQQTGVHIMDTTAHFTLRNVFVHGGGDAYGGIVLESCSNASIMECRVIRCASGIAAEWCNNLTVSGNYCIDNTGSGVRVGVLPLLGGITTISNNTVAGNGHYGINCEGGGGQGALIADNYVTDSTLDGIHVHWLHDSVISRNVVINEDFEVSHRSGIYMGCSSNILISNNTFTNVGGYPGSRGTGVEILSGMGGDNITVVSNSVMNWDCGIHSALLPDTVIVSNLISRNVLGLNISSGNAVVYGNSFDDNIVQATVPSFDAIWLAASVVWNSSYPVGGNFWSDYEGADDFSGPHQDVSGADGIGDVPYVLNDNNSDHYPLMDDVPPSTSAQLSGTLGENGWYLSEVEAGLEAYDDWSDIDCTQFRIDGSEWEEYSAPFEISDDGIHTLECFSEDGAGNIEDIQSTQVKIDCTAPLLDITTENGTVFDTDTVNITLTCSDPCSGVDCVEYSLDDGAYVVCEIETCIQLSSLSNGTHQLSVRIHDQAGNEVAQELTFEVSIAADDDDGDEDTPTDTSSYWLTVGAAIAVVAAVCVVAVFAMKRRGRKPPE